MRSFVTLFGVLGTIFLATYIAFAISIPTGTPYSQNFDAIGTSATATLPADFRVDKLSTSAATQVRTVGTFASALSATQLAGGVSLSSSASNGIYNFGA